MTTTYSKVWIACYDGELVLRAGCWLGPWGCGQAALGMIAMRWRVRDIRAVRNIVF